MSAKPKKLKVSRNRKKSWRKHTDIKDIEEYLDDQRLDERIGPKVTEKQDEDLFMIEKAGDDKAYQKKLETFQKSQNLAISAGDSKLRHLSSTYKLYGKLNSTTNVPPVGSKVPNKEKRKTIYNDSDKLEKYWNDKKEAIENGRMQKEARKEVYADPKSKFKSYDLWVQEEKKPKAEDYQVNPQPPIRVPEHLRQKPSLLPAVEVPLGAQSYNPHQEEHKELFLKATKIEVEKINEEKRWTNKVEKHYVPKEEAYNEKTWLAEMSQGLGLFEQNGTEEEETPENVDEIAQFTKLIKSEKKTKQQRRRELREKLAKKKKTEEKSLRMKENEIFRLKTFKKELEQRDKKIAKRAQKRAQRHIESLYKPKRLSRFRFEESEIPLNLPSEISGSLRNVKVEGSLLDDRFKSLQKRNIIEPRVRQTIKRKFKLKKEIKKRHRSAT